MLVIGVFLLVIVPVCDLCFVAWVHGHVVNFGVGLSSSKVPKSMAYLRFWSGSWGHVLE